MMNSIDQMTSGFEACQRVEASKPAVLASQPVLKAEKSAMERVSVN